MNRAPTAALKTRVFPDLFNGAGSRISFHFPEDEIAVPSIDDLQREISFHRGFPDEVFEFHGVPVVVDKRSLMYLSDAMVDFHDDLNRRGFSVTNPNAKSTCGCGSSFSM